MKKHLRAIAILAGLSPVCAMAAGAPLAVTGLVSNPLHLTLADLSGFPATHVSATQVSGRGPVPLDCTGASLAAILDKAVLNLGSKNNAKLAHSVLISADDGYAVALSLGEIDPDYGNESAIIATTCNGKPMDAPRLVVPSDKHGGRAVNGVVSIEVK
jgi:DMSO/TMAO reductase YedYZ molybdopterin-dependent catalytic subunit